MIPEQLIDQFRVPPGSAVRLKDHDPGWAQTDELAELGKDAVKERAQHILEQKLADLAAAQELLYADGRYALLIIFQGMDASGKDGMIKHVMSGVNPQGCQVFSFKKPSAEELAHTFLWRCDRCLPERGRIGIFNRSYYEEVLVVKVHPELLAAQRLPDTKFGKKFWQRRYQDINTFEQHLVGNGTVLLKFFLHISKDEQKKRFLDRLTRPEKHWKFSPADLAERVWWDEYVRAYEACLSATSTPEAPWYVIPADHKWVARAVVADIITNTLRSLDLHHPEPTEEQRQQLAEARKRLEAE
jgi:PPK2 family polyphosphate:nucleotide phosphotransferase